MSAQAPYLVGFGLLLSLRVYRFDAVQQIDRVVELRVLRLLRRHIGRASRLFLIGFGAVAFVTALEMSAQVGLATGALGFRLLLEIVGQLLLDHSLWLDALGLNRAA